MKPWKKIVIVIVSLVFTFCVIRIGLGFYDAHVAKNEYEDSKDIAQVPEITMPKEAETTSVADPIVTPPDTDVDAPVTEPEPEPDENAIKLLRETDLASLKATNDDVIGWIVIPDSKISFPIVQGEDNEHYLFHTWAGRWSWSGAIYLDMRNAPDMSDFHSIIYGHNMYGGEMFAGLLLYRDQAYYDTHPSIYVVTEGAARRYDIFSAYEADLNTDKTYLLGITAEEKKSAYLRHCEENSEIECEVTDKIAPVLTLSTCVSVSNADPSRRFVVQAKLAYEVTAEEIENIDIAE